MTDNFGRTINYLRISVTDRCNFRCIYCMPKCGVKQLPHAQILRYEEILHIVEIMAQLGIHRFRLTGGEPLVRPHLYQLVEKLKKIDGVETVALTTNGFLLHEQLDDLVSAGLDEINISLDAMSSNLFEKITCFPGIENVFKSIFRALSSPIKVKLNCVALGINDSELSSIAELARNNKLDVRFIELMPIGLGSCFSTRKENEIISLIRHITGPLIPDIQSDKEGPCKYYTADGFLGRIGFISPISHKFCHRCNRIRLTSDGFLKTCLQYNCGMDLKPFLNSEDDILKSAIIQAVQNKPACHNFGQFESDQRKMYQIGG